MYIVNDYERPILKTNLPKTGCIGETGQYLSFKIIFINVS